jgi:hypothetical protein
MGVRGAINHLHLLRYAEQREWSRLVTIPESGILITPEQGEVFSYLLRHRQLPKSKLAISLDSEVGAFVAKASAGAQMEVTMKWKPRE